MAQIADMVKALRGERSRALNEVAKLDKAIASLRQLPDANSKASPNGRHEMSAAARKKIAKAQRARWAKFKKEKAARA